MFSPPSFPTGVASMLYRSILFFLPLVWVGSPGGPHLKASPPRPNVLMIAVDDLNDWVGCLGGHPQTRTPHIDGLGGSGTIFANAHCQAPLCNPSRSSLLTGLRPSTTGIHGLVPGIRQVEATRKRQTLPQAFLQAGYHTYTCGKVFHDGSIPRDPSEFSVWGPAPGLPKPAQPIARLPNPRHPAMDWGPYPDRDEEHGDYRIAQAAIAAINNAPENRPFFITCGFRLPHVPCLAPPKWFEPFPLDSLILPQVKDNERAQLSSFAWRLHWRLPEPRLSTLREYNEWKPLVRAYLASIHFMDAQVGRVLDALKKSGKAEKTIIVLWSDHGYHLGEKEISGKNTLWERSTRVPLIFAGPGVSRQGRCLEPVELLDIYPTLVDICSLAKVEGLEGHSLRAQLKDSGASRPWPAITTHNQGNHAIRTRDHRYIRYADGSEELYDHRNDPLEWTNLAAKPEAKPIVAELSRWLPKVDVPAAPGSKHRILTYDPATGIATWEGEQVKPGDLPPGP